MVCGTENRFGIRVARHSWLPPLQRLYSVAVMLLCVTTSGLWNQYEECFLCVWPYVLVKVCFYSTVISFTFHLLVYNRWRQEITRWGWSPNFNFSGYNMLRQRPWKHHLDLRRPEFISQT